MAFERRLFLLAVILLHSMNYTNAMKDKKYIQEISKGKEIVGDGNCFYRCLSVYLHGHQNEHSTIRENIILYMSGGSCESEAENEERSRRYGRLMHNTRQSYEDYLRLHSNNGEWADEPIIQAAADLYGFNIYVTSYTNSGVSQLVRATSLQLPSDSSRLLHLRLENSHYTCIEHDCQTDSVPSGDFVEVPDVIDFGKQNGAEPYKDSLDVLDYRKTVGLPKTVKDDKSNDVGMDPFNISKQLNESISERRLINTSVVDKTPKQEFIRCRDREHLTELCQNGQVAFGTVCKVLRRRPFCNYFHYFMFLDIWPDTFDIVHLNKTYSLKIICKIINVSFANGSNSLFDFQNGLYVECLNFPISENQKEEIWRRLYEGSSYPYLNYSLTSEDGCYCESLINYIKTGEKISFEVTNFRERYPVRGPIIIHSVNWFAYLTSLGINAFKMLKNYEYNVKNANNEFEIILWLLSRVPFAIVNNHIENNDNDDNNNNCFNNNYNNKGDKTDN